MNASCVPDDRDDGAITAVQEADLRTAKLQLSDPSREMKTKVEAAELLLDRGDNAATKTLADFLSDASNPKARQAICLAIYNNGGGPKPLVTPLLKMLTGSDQTVRLNSAQALSAYRGGGVLAKVIQVAGDEKLSADVRLAAIDSLSRVPDRRSVEELIKLLADYDTNVRSSAAAGLTRMTGINSFGVDRNQWMLWWEKNRDKDNGGWASEVTEAMSKNINELQLELKQLKTRLGQICESGYMSIPPGPARDAKLLEMLKDPMAEIRAIGLRLAGQASDQKLPPDVGVQVRLLLSDSDVVVRQAAAAALANDTGEQTLGLLLGRLKIEDASPVRQEILKAIGQIGSIDGVTAVLSEMGSQDDNVAAAAAVALTKIAQKHPLEGQELKSAAASLEARYRQIRQGYTGGMLRESLLRAMGVIGGDELHKVLRESLRDQSATIRQAAVNSLRLLKATDAASEILPLVDDPDRGVRQSAIEALGIVGGQKDLPVVLRRTDPSVESDATVRQKAWDAVKMICSGSDVKTIKDVLASLGNKEHVLSGKIRLMQVLAEKLKAASSPELPDVLRTLGLALVSDGRLSEASPVFGEAYALYKSANAPQAEKVWSEWVDSMLAADDAGVIKVIAGVQSVDDFAKALTKLNERMEILSGKRDWMSLFRLADEAVRQFGDRLTGDQKQAMVKYRDLAKTEQAAADRTKIAELVVQLVSTDESARKTAETELKGMGTRAIKPMLEELKKALTASKANPQQEKAILDMIRQIAPNQLNDYDITSPVEQRVKLVTSKLEEV